MTSPTTRRRRLVVALFFCGVWNFVDPSPVNDSSAVAGTTYLSLEHGDVARTTDIRRFTAPTSHVTPPSRVRSTRQSVEKHNSISSSVHIRFNCDRPRTSCAVNSTCLNGRCSCDDGYEGYDCALETESIVAACDPPCLNGGTCYSQHDPAKPGSKTYLCYCTEAFHGVSCEKERVYHKCNPGSMEMYVAPIVGSGDRFVGNVYIMGHEDDDRCVFGRHGNDDETFYSLIRFDECGGAVNHTDQSSGVTSLSWRVVVRYDDVLLETDQELTFSCYMRQPGASYDWHAWMLAHDNVLSNLPSRTLASDVQPVNMELLTDDGRQVAGPQQLGTNLQLKYTLNGGDVYDSFRVDKVAVSNALTGTKRHAVNLVSAGCVTDDALKVKRIVQSMQRSPNATTMTLHFKVFKLRYSSQLVFENVIKACRRSVDCRPPECRQSMAAPARKRRAAGETNDATLTTSYDDQGPTKTFRDSNATLTVWYPSELLHRDHRTDECRYGGSLGECVHGYVFLIAGSVALILITVTSVTAVVICWHKR